MATANPSYSYRWFNGDSALNVTDSLLTVRSSGNYSVTATDTYRCMNFSDTLSVTVNALLPKPEIVFDKNILTTDSAGRIQWYFNNDTIPGAVNDTLAVSDPGNYYLVVTSDSGCSTVSDTLNLTILEIEYPGFPGMTVYPNPAGNFLKIKSRLIGPAWIRITRTDGTSCYTGNLNLTGNDLIDLSGLSPGYYILTVVKDEKSHTAKFIRE